MYYEDRNTGVLTGTNQNSDTTSVRLDLPVNTNYLLNIVSCNIVGCGPASHNVSFTTVTQGKSNTGHKLFIDYINANIVMFVIQ